MKCQIPFPGNDKKNISKCCLLKILPTVLSVNKTNTDQTAWKKHTELRKSLCRTCLNIHFHLLRFTLVITNIIKTILWKPEVTKVSTKTAFTKHTITEEYIFLQQT